MRTFTCVTRHLLDIEYDYDFELIGICCTERDYRVAWAVNQCLNIQLQRESEDLEVALQKEPSRHPLYRYHCELTHISYELIANKGSGGYLVPEQRHADYFLLLYDNIILNVSDVVATLRNLTFVSLAFEIDAHSLKHKENLITN